MDGREGPLASSLRFRLSAWISATILLGAFAAGARSYVDATEDAHRLQDVQLRQIGQIIGKLDAVPASPQARARAGDIDFDARIVLRFIAGEGGRPILCNGPPPCFSDELADGLQTVDSGGEQWRVYVRTNDKGIRAAVAQQTAMRDAIARGDAARTVMPLLVLAPLLALLVTILVRLMFRPLRTLTAQLGARQEHETGDLERSALPSEVWPFVAEINRLIARTARTIARQRRFIADAAHELRSPMTAMSLQAERLAASEMSPEARTRLDALSAGIGRTRILLDQLLTLARIQEAAAGESGDGAAVSLKRAILECLEDLVPLAEAKGIDLGVVGDADPLVAGPLVDLKTLVKNLIDNAIRYTPPGGRVDIRVGVDAGPAGRWADLHVEDSGPGIPAAERARVFDAFYRVLGNGQIGSGLGLAITGTIAARLGAKIALGDAPQGGLDVHVRFPLQDAD
ncbi:ATP-binding protein [Herbaspirillum sp. SJZ107]|uniref:ATP-binding protein n=1 Tax=Herbaspirillum sp. SJZ107 TaxID=2572881 RepID=UPI001152E61F|nr:ATP-binding protein [Herbaspirillum sp. SJZ107]TQK11286.1 two-component system OmpR family sensor kinase [Herbaspirillum sp. SJZ107]